MDHRQSFAAGLPPRVLFVCKDRHHEYDHDRPASDWNHARSTGLFNSVRYLVDMLIGLNVAARMVVVTDNNSIDREVHDYRPTHVFVEALWVVPEKFDVLKKLHPHVQWFVRLHSETPFLSTEGVAIDWIKGYLARGVGVVANSERVIADLELFTGEHIGYLPNYYRFEAEPRRFRRSHADVKRDGLNVGCFGAMRPMKNIVAQAAAAIEFANEMRVPLRFHANTERVDAGGEPVLRNLRAAFRGHPTAKLIEHRWMEHDCFLRLASEMDICMQVSLTETFNIVAADCTSVGVPVVTSAEIRWGCELLHASPTSMYSMVRALRRAWQYGRGRMGLWRFSHCGLRRHNDIVIRVWSCFLDL